MAQNGSAAKPHSHGGPRSGESRLHPVVLFILSICCLIGCAAPREPLLNAAGDQAKRTGTLIRVGSTMAFHEIDPVKVTFTAGPPPSATISLGAVVFNPPLLTATSAYAAKLTGASK